MSARSLLAAAVVAAATLSPAAARAAGPYFLLELDTGLAESAYTTGDAGAAFGASLGTTFKLRASPIRWALLGTIASRSGSVTGLREGFLYAAERDDLDLYGSVRMIVPVWRALRVYGELGYGRRFQEQTLDRSTLGRLTSQSSDPLLVVALGAQYRLSRTFSVGLRAQLDPLDPEPDLATLAAGLAPTDNRASMMAQLGIHF
ncbi:outer membrane beta-barrel protein [Myxococcota bacterium]|nr:outer membrane beta-barrel protein [Myxococcota bacterium]